MIGVAFLALYEIGPYDIQCRGRLWYGGYYGLGAERMSV